VVGPRWAELAAAMRAPSVVMGFIAGQDCPQVPSADDQHLIDDLGPGGEHEPFRIGVRLRIPRRDLHHFDAGTSQYRIERACELPGPVAGQEPQVRGAIP
jgi:hypothetical protein